MDKETLSHYGWIVILVLILSVLLALATPLGSFIASGIKSTTAGLFNVNQAAIGSLGLTNIPNQNFTEPSLQYTILQPTSESYERPDYVESASFDVKGQIYRIDKLKNITVNGIEITPLSDGSWSYNMTLVKDETTELTIVITDTDNKENIEKRYVMYTEVTSYALILNNSSNSDNPVPMIFVKSPVPIVAGEIYNSDTYGELTVVEAYANFENSYSAPWQSYSSTLTSVVCEDNIVVTSSAYRWFREYQQLKYVDISKMGTSLLLETFYRCSQLKEILLPSTLESISSFYGCESLESIVLPDGLKTIAAQTFWNCKNLKSITIPQSLVSIGSAAFSDTPKLTAMYITDIASWCNVSRDGIWAHPFYGSDGETTMYLNNNPITDLVIPNNVQSIDAFAFYCTDSITSLNIPDSVKTIGAYAFSGCKNMSGEVKMPNQLISIGEYAFSQCNISSLILPNTIETIENRAFEHCKNISSLNIPPSLKFIGQQAFNNCTSLTSIYITDLTAWYNMVAESAAKPSKYTLYLNNEIVTDVIIPSGMTEISDNLFSGCISLKTIKLPEGVTTIGKHAFGGCSNLTSIELPNSVITIKDSAFSNCKSLVLTNLPENVTSIGKSAFYDCHSLTSIRLPNNLTHIGKDAFRNCVKLASANITNPSGWTLSDNTALSADDLADTAIAAKYLKSTYHSYEWNRS